MKDFPSEVDARDASGRTRLHTAAAENAHQDAEALLKQGADPNATDEDGEMPLHTAARNNTSTIAEMFGTNPNATDKYGETPLHWGRTPLHWAGMSNKREVVEVLLAGGADPNTTNNKGQTPLHSAGLGDTAEVAEVLLAHGADPNTKDEEGWTPLHSAVWNNTGKVAKTLWANYWANTYVVYVEVWRDATKVAEVLLAHRADPNAKDNEGQTPLDMAVANNADEVAELLRQQSRQTIRRLLEIC